MIASWMISPEIGRGLFFLAVVFLVGWFAAGMFANVRKGNRVARWLQEGLPVVGEKTTLRWLGSSGVELKIQNPRKPFRNVEVFILLEPRDIPLLWGYFHARGRRDVLIVRCHSSSSPRFGLEVADPHAWSARGTQLERVRKEWASLPSPAGAHLAAFSDGPSEVAGQVLALAVECGLPLVRLAVRDSAPQLEVHWQLRDFENVSARRLFERLLQMNQSL